MAVEKLMYQMNTLLIRSEYLKFEDFKQVIHSESAGEGGQLNSQQVF